MSNHPVHAAPNGRHGVSGRVRAMTLAVVALAAVAGLALVPVSSAQAHAGADSTGYAWDQPVVTVRSTVPEAWGVRTAVRRWNAERVQGQPRLVLRADAVNPDVVIRTVNRPGQWWTGLTTGNGTDGTITDIAISLNTASISESRYRYRGSRDAAKHWTTSHELGHALGLEHSQSVKRSVMSYSNPWWRTEGRPSAYDFRQLGRIY
jgi:predicted Zn-dependent protease